jgi:hypothetical protein
MRRTCIRTTVIAMALVTLFGAKPVAAQDKNTVMVPGGLGFAEFKGYENWTLVSISHNGDLMAAILGNPVMIQAYKAGFPGNGKPIPDGARMAKIHWNPAKMKDFPTALQAGSLHDVDFMVKDSKRFATSGGWGYAAFRYDTAGTRFTPATTADMPPQGNDATCGFGCHSIVKSNDYVFTKYGAR